MPLGSSKLGFVKNAQYGVGGTGIPVDNNISIDLALTGNTAVNLINTGVTNQTQDANTVTYNIDTNFVNTTIGYNFTGVVSSDFTDATITGTVVTDANGNASVAKTVTNSGGHKIIAMDVIRPGSNLIIGSANTLNLYEVTPITMSGGDTTTTTNIAQPQYNQDGNIVLSSRIHKFTASGNATLTVTNLGNYESNANIWENQYMTTASVGSALSQGSYWQNGVGIRSLIIGSGGQSNPGGAGGEFGILKYPIANVSPGSYTMHVAYAQSNTYVFRGNVTLEKMAGGGQSSAGTTNYSWGSGFGGSNAVSGSPIRTDSAPSDLADNVANASYPTNLTQYVEFASAFRGGYGYSMTRDGGGGAGGVGGQFYNSETSNYGISPFGKGGSNGDGGHGISLVNTRNYPGTSVSPQNPTELSSNIANSWHLNPMADGTSSVEDVAGGKAGSQGSNGIGATGYGGGASAGGTNKFGLVTINYPYRPAYRFVTTTDLS